MKTFNDHTLSLEVAASTFAALGSEQRLHVLRTLVRAGPDGLPIGILGDRCGVDGVDPNTPCQNPEPGWPGDTNKNGALDNLCGCGL